MNVIAGAIPPLARILGCALALGGCVEQTTSVVSTSQPLAEESSLLEPSHDRLRGTYQFVSADEETAAVTDEKTIIYVNRLGGLYMPGGNDSRKNLSSLISEPTTLEPWSAPDDEWLNLLRCVDTNFAPFNVDVVDFDPGSQSHIEAVVAGWPENLGQPNHVGGLSPFRLDCGVIDNAVVFTFAERFGTEYEELCNVVSQEIAHAFGLDHEVLCSDPMSYIGGCGKKQFTNMDAPCGEFEERPCACGEDTQNSLKILSQRLGDRVRPSAAFELPLAGDVVNPDFYVVVDATDNVEIEQVELYIDGERIASRVPSPYVFHIAGSVAVGEHELEVRAYDSENVTSTVIDIVVDDSVAALGPPGVLSQAEAPTQPDAPEVGGGCDVGGSHNATLGWMLAALATLAVRRRRRRNLAR